MSREVAVVRADRLCRAARRATPLGCGVRARSGLRGTLAAWVVAVAATACDQTAVVDVTADRKVYHIAFTAESGPLPGGDFGLRLGLLSMDLTLPDAFGRATAPLATYTQQDTPLGLAYGFDVAGAIRNSNTDRRAPVLSPSAAAPTLFFRLFSPAFTGVGPGFWNLWGFVTGLKPNTVYTVVLARMALQVRGELDQPAILTGGQDPPDSLYYLGGSPAGNSTAVQCVFQAGIAVDASRNPVALGWIVTDGAGNASIDCVPVAVGDSPWWRNASSEIPPAAADSLPFGLNQPGAILKPGQYNYILLIEGTGTDEDPIPPGPPTIRAQVGPDIDATGAVIPNAFAPFPSGPMSGDALQLAPGFRGVPEEVTLVLRGLPELFGDGVYKAWLFDSENPARPPVPGVGMLSLIVGGQTVPGGLFSTWRGDLNATARLVISDATLGGARLRDYDHVAVSVENGDAAVPSTPAMWARYVDHRNTPDDFLDNINIQSGALNLGSFRPDDPARSRSFTANGTVRASFFRDTLLVVADGAAVPPPGFRYELWLQPRNGDGPPRYAGTLPVDEHGLGSQRIAESLVGRFGDYARMLITLEANAAPALPGPYRIFISEDWTEKFRDVFGPPPE